jgi:hypothetical protein
LSQSEFSKLRDKWYQKLEDSGFRDIETTRGNLRQYDRRTIAFENRDSIREFFIRLDHFLTEERSLPSLDRQMLSLYTQGQLVKEICRVTQKSHYVVNKILTKYKKLLTGR